MAFSVDAFLERIRDLRGQAGDGVVVEVREPIRVSPGSLPDGLRIANFHFHERVKLRGLRFENDVVIENCIFEKGLDLSASQCRARFRLRRCRFGSYDNSTHDPLLDLSFVRFRSDVELAGIESWGAIVGRACRVAGEMRFVSAIVSACGRNNPPLDLSHAQIHGRLLLHDRTSRWIAEDATLSAGSRLDLPLCSNEQPTILAAADVLASDAVDLRKMQVAGLVSLSHVKCIGSVDCTFSTFGNLSAHAANIAGDLVLSGAELGYFHAYGITLAGSLTMIAGASGQIDIDSYFDAEKTVPTSMGAVICSGWRCTHWARFGLRSLGRQSSESSPNSVRGIWLNACTIAGDLEFFSGINAMRQFNAVRGSPKIDDARPLDCNPFLAGLATNDPIVITACKVGGHLDLTNVRTRDTVDLSDCVVTNSIRFSSPLSARAAKAGKDEIRKALILLCCALRRDDMQEPHQRMMTATARRLHMERTSAGAVDLTGLELVARGTEDGSILASHITVAREFQSARRDTAAEHQHFVEGITTIACRPKDVVTDLLEGTLRHCLHKAAKGCVSAENPVLAYMEYAGIGASGAQPPVARALIPGMLRLNSANIGLLRLSHESFEKEGHDGKPGAIPTDEATIIVLDDAEIGVLRIYRTHRRPAVPKTAVKGNGFPRPVSLRGVRVGSWRLGGTAQPMNGHGPSNLESADDETMESSDSEPYLDLLDNDKEYRASTYLSVERSLRDRGHVDAANEVFIAGRFRSLRANLPKDDPNVWVESQGRVRPPLPQLGARWRSGSHRMFFRLNRSPRETLESLAVMVLVAIMIAVGVVLSRLAYGTLPFYPPAFALLFGLLLGALVVALSLYLIGPARDPLDRFFDRMFWSLVDYGTSAWRLLGVILLLMAATFLFVAPNARNFEPTPVASLAEGQLGHYELPCSRQTPKWSIGEGIWMTLRYHIPIVSLAVVERCVPTDEPIFLAEYGPFRSFESRDWFGTMAVLNYILWPLFIPFLIRKFWREDRRG